MLIKSPERELLTNSPKMVNEDEQLYQSAFGSTTKYQAQTAYQRPRWICAVRTDGHIQAESQRQG